MIRNRKGEVIVTNEGQNRLLKRLYGTSCGRFLLKLLTAPFLSRTAGAFMDSRPSKLLIKPFIRRSGIDMSQFEQRDFRSYNDFFTRKVLPGKRPVDMTPEHLISPCDSKLTVYPIDRKSIFRIKGSRYRISDLLGSRELAEGFCGGLCLIFRLEVDDYHRYCYFDSGTKTDNVFIPGELHTVNPIALEKYNIYKRNSREYTLMDTDNFGRAAQIEVGAMMVGRICNRDGAGSIVRGREKGKFEFGGSTAVVLLEKGRASIDGDILRNSSEGIETAVKYGEKIGEALK